MAGVEIAAPGHPAVLASGCGSRHCTDRRSPPRPQRPHPLWPLPRRRRTDRIILGTNAHARLTATARGPMRYRVGLTGGIGCGKSTVAALFREFGATVIDSDAISHQLTQPSGSAIEAIRAAFGDSYIDGSGALDRVRMRHLVFSGMAARQSLEGILHPL